MFGLVKGRLLGEWGNGRQRAAVAPLTRYLLTNLPVAPCLSS